MTDTLDYLGHNAVIPDDFVMPQIGDTVEVLVDRILPCGRTREFDGVLRAGAIGTVLEIRLPVPPGEVPRGYCGLVVLWTEIRAAYPSGIVLRWDVVSDPTRFRCFPRSP